MSVILNIALSAPYNDYWGYQDNLLPKYQRKLGHQVIIITTNTKHDNRGNVVEIEEDDYILKDGVRVIRLKKRNILGRRISNLLGVCDLNHYLEETKPDLIFFHGLINFSIIEVVRYKKRHRECIIVQDNHLDYNIGFDDRTVRKKFLRTCYRMLNSYSQRWVDKVYGVTPWRVAYAEKYFKIASSKTDLLIMGADDENVRLNDKIEIRRKIRNKYLVNDNEFLIVTGGKIDEKKKILVLMKACKSISNVKLLIFGSLDDKVKVEFMRILDQSTNIFYIGWIESERVYDYFFAADLAFFPGQHSVLWEQACAAKIPCVFEKWEGMEHVNNGGNSEFISPVTEANIKETVLSLAFTDKYKQMKEKAESYRTDIYLYSYIAAKSLECLKGKYEK